MNTKKEELLRLNEKVMKCSARLSEALQEISKKASEVYGEEMAADLCNGDELEFRRVLGDGVSDPFNIIGLEQILKKC